MIEADTSDVGARVPPHAAALPLILVIGTWPELDGFLDQAAPRPDCAYLLLPLPSPTGRDARSTAPGAVRMVELGAGQTLRAGLVLHTGEDQWVRLDGDRILPGIAAGSGGATRGRLDTLLDALGRRPGARNLAVFLSGSNGDGVLGALALAEAGGLVLVHGASAGGGPAAPLVHSGAARPVAHIAQIGRMIDDLLDTGTCDTDPERDIVLADIRRTLSSACRLDFDAYKPRLLPQRAEARRAALGLPDLAAYRDRLARDCEELTHLYNDFLLGATMFHRDPDAFAALRAVVIDPLVRSRAAEGDLRIWVAGCATGEEAYSVAMELDDAMRCAGILGDFRIIATDVHAQAIEVASEGRYREEAAANLPAHLDARYLRRQDGQVSVSCDLRRRIIFSDHDVLGESPFMDLDLVVCRNMLMYLRRDPRARVLSMLRFGLRPGGFLFLGRHEIPSGAEDALQPVDTRARIFCKTDAERGLPGARAPGGNGTAPVAMSDPVAANRAAVLSELEHVRDRGAVLQAYGAMLHRFAPPSILLTGEGIVLSWFGAAQLFVSPDRTGGIWHIDDLLHEDLAAVLDEALAALRKSDEAAVARDLRIRMQPGEVLRGRLELEAIQRVSGKWLLLATLRLPARATQAPPAAADPAPGIDAPAGAALPPGLAPDLLGSASRQALDRLEASSEALQQANVELRASNQDLRTSNEHLQFANDALQRMNRDLMASANDRRDGDARLGSDPDLSLKALEALGAAVLMIDPAMRVLRRLGGTTHDSAAGPPPGSALSDAWPDVDAPDLPAAVARVCATGTATACPARTKGRVVTLRLEPVDLPAGQGAQTRAVMIVLPGPA